MAVVINGDRWTEYKAAQMFPVFPAREKASEVRATLRAQQGVVVHDQTWAGWMKRLVQERLLIRLPGARFARPRSEADFVHHVKPFTKRQDATVATRRQELRHAVEATKPKK